MVYTRTRRGKKSMSTLRSTAPRRRRKKKARKNSWFGEPERHAQAARKGWRRRRKRLGLRKKPARKRKAAPRTRVATRRRTRRNPVYRSRARRTVRRRRAYRRNPVRGFRRAFTRQWIMQSVDISLGIISGMIGMPVIYAIVPAGMKRHRNFFGLFHLAIGSILVGMTRGARAKTVGTVLAGMGAYDLIAANTQAFLGLPPLPVSGRLADMLRRPEAEPVGLSYYGTKDAISADYRSDQIGADYTKVDAVGADFTAHPGTSLTVGLGFDDCPFTDY